MWQTLASLVLAIEIHGAGECPAAVDVERRLGPLLGAPTAADTADVATIKHAADGTLSVALADNAGRPLGDRRFPRAGSCENRAETVAVTLAVWEAQIHPEIALRLDRLSPEATPAPAPPESTTLRHVPEAPPRAATAFTLGASLAGDWQSGAVAPAARVELGLGRPGGRWRARFGVLAVARHTIDVVPGRASWWRAALSVGADLDVARGRRFALVFGVDALGGVASISGVGFAMNRTSHSVDAGGGLRARAEWRPGRVRPWVGVSLVGWMRKQSLDLEGEGAASALPRLEPLAALGADIAW
jgi:hypothetical protein